MMEEKIENIISYWKESSDQDYKTMNHLLVSSDFHWSLFIGHLVIEKLLKAHYVKKTGQHAIFTHDLLRLASRTELNLDPTKEEWLDKISTFN